MNLISLIALFVVAIFVTTPTILTFLCATTCTVAVIVGRSYAIAEDE